MPVSSCGRVNWILDDLQTIPTILDEVSLIELTEVPIRLWWMRSEDDVTSYLDCDFL